MTTEELVEHEGEVKLDRLQPSVVLVPCYINLSTTFVMNLVSLRKTDQMMIRFYRGPYVAQSMRMAVAELLKDQSWERLIVLEQDMLLPKDGLLKHALHTDDIVGSAYFQHSPPYRLNCLLQDPVTKKFAHPSDMGVKRMLEKPALYKCALVGLGLTSIARHVLEDWTPGLPTFMNECVMNGVYDDESAGEISHDVYFCREALKQDRQVWIDTSIQCRHITEGYTDHGHWRMNSLKENPGLWPEITGETTSGIILPNRSARRRAKYARAV